MTWSGSSFRSKAGPKDQIATMKHHFPGFRYRIRQGGVVWTGSLQPTPESPVYRVRIRLKRDSAPRVYVDEPRIPRAPHRYEDNSLCLFWPGEWLWNDEESLAETIVPWTALWLYYYELWLICGEWLGPEAPHDGDKKPPSPESP